MILDILRQGKIQSFEYTPKTDLDTVATALTALNMAEPLRDIDGNAASPIGWECGCLQKKCGACAVVINGTPGLACNTRLSDYGERVRIEPLKKFPLVKDLIVDREAMLEGLKELNMWLEGNAELTDKKQDICFESSRCLQCGCCLEICPNFKTGGSFKGMAAAVPMTRLLLNAKREQTKTLSKTYSRHIYEGCGKSLACRNICPAKIDIERTLVNSNAVVLWKRFFSK